MRYRFWSRLLQSALLSFSILLLAACGSGGGGDSSKSEFSELLLVSEGDTLKAVSVSGTSATVLSTAAIPGIPGTYSRSGNEVTVTIPGNIHSTGDWVDLVFSAGTGGTATSGVYRIASNTTGKFTVIDSAAGTITDGKVLLKFATTREATYVQNGTTITITLTGRDIGSDQPVLLDFTSGDAADGQYRVATTPDLNTFTVTAAASATTSGNVKVTVRPHYNIFDVAMHPSGKWLYTVSMYEYWWGAGFISRFAIDWSTGKLTFEESFTDGNAGNAPVGLAFSSDGTRLVNQDDSLDGLQMWSVNPSTGALTFIAQSPGTYLHGVCFSSGDTRVYNGNTVFTLEPDAIPETYNGHGGQSNTIINGTLYSVDDSNGPWRIVTYSLADPDAPTEITSISTANENEARAIAVSSDGKRIVSAGWSGLKSYNYDGVSITPAQGAGSTEYIDGGSWASGNGKKMFRQVSMNSAGNKIATSYQTQRNGYGFPPAGFMVFDLAADGSLTLIADEVHGARARAAKFVQKP